MTAPVPEIRHVVVGVDGSATSECAADYAIKRAKEQEVTITLLHARPVSMATAVDSTDLDQIERLAERLRAAGAQLSVDMARTSPSAALIGATAPDTLVVIGTRGHSGLPGLLTGSVASAVVGAGEGPIVVVSKTSSGEGPVTVGIDVDDPAQEALSRAASEARRAGVPLRVIHAWRVEAARGPLPLEAEQAERQRRLEALLATADAQTAGLDMSATASHGEPDEVLLREAQASSLLVVGSRGRGALTGALLGSVSRSCAAKADCPVMVVQAESNVTGHR